LRQPVISNAERLLQREQWLRQPLTAEERSVLIPQFDADIRLLERITARSFDHWRDVGHAIVRQPLAVRGRFGTAHVSIDRPLGS
jgi:hypothetical protein